MNAFTIFQISLETFDDSYSSNKMFWSTQVYVQDDIVIIIIFCVFPFNL